MPFGDEEPIAKAEACWQRGRDEECESLLLATRRALIAAQKHDTVCRVELALAVWSLAIDDENRALAHLEAASAAHSLDSACRAVSWCVTSQLARRVPGTTHVEPPEGLLEGKLDRTTRVEVLIEAAIIARLRGEHQRAWQLLEDAVVEAEGAPRLLAFVQLECGELLLATSRVQEARASFREAIRVFHELGLARLEGRALLRFAGSIAPAMAGEEPPAVWLGRAQAALGSCATWRDRAALRAGFRVHGRRQPDAVFVEGMANRVDQLDRACSLLRGATAITTDAAARAFDRLASAVGEEKVSEHRPSVESLSLSTAPLIGEIERASRELVELMGSALVERDRMQAVLRAVGALDAIVEINQFSREATRLIRSLLGADAVGLAQCGLDGELTLLASDCEQDVLEEALWKHAVSARLKVPSAPPPDSLAPSLRSESRPKGPVLVIPIRSARFSGALYADKLRRVGQFRDSDFHIASLLAEYLAQGLSRVKTAEAETLARAQLAATVDAIRDGVLAIDSNGVVRHLNAAAARMLRVSESGLHAKRLSASASLVPLEQALLAAPRSDGAVVRLPHGTIVVTSRPIGTQGDSAAQGVVATLVELDRAQRIAARVTSVRPRFGFHDIVGGSPALQEALRLARQAATVDANVLITGESGTGKEVLAQAIHTGGSRSGEPFIGINCAALPRELLEAELFGYERGAFTGARSDGSVGKFEQAGDGTILLDEIGDMPLDMQVKLLRVLQERVVVRLGGGQERPFSARVIATTHRNLEESVKKGTFRLDLFYRLRVLHIELPPLRERRDDILPLAMVFLRRMAEAQGKRVKSIGDEVGRRMLSYPWPGNVRELANVIEREVSLVSSSITSLENFEIPLGGALGFVDQFTPESPTSSKMKAVRASAEAAVMPSDIIPLTEVERRTFLDAYSAFGGNVTRAAKALGVSKVTFYAKLRQWGMHPSDEPGPETLRKIKIVERGDDDPGDG